MRNSFAKYFLSVALVAGLLVVNAFAGTLVSAAVTPSVVAPGSTVFIHDSVINGTLTNQAVTVMLSVTNPGACVTGHLPSQAGALAFTLRPRETRISALSMNIPPATVPAHTGSPLRLRTVRGRCWLLTQPCSKSAYPEQNLQAKIRKA